jgi:hypothetical protein
LSAICASMLFRCLLFSLGLAMFGLTSAASAAKGNGRVLVPRKHVAATPAAESESVAASFLFHGLALSVLLRMARG